MDGPRASILDALEHEQVVWLSTTRPDGGPHVVPLWFVWDGRSIVAFSKPHAQKVRNLRADPRVMVAVGRADATFDVELDRGLRAGACHDGPDSVADEFVRKYAARRPRMILVILPTASLWAAGGGVHQQADQGRPRPSGTVNLTLALILAATVASVWL